VREEVRRHESAVRVAAYRDGSARRDTAAAKLVNSSFRVGDHLLDESVVRLRIAFG
jgi:hypothetical protein